MRKVIIKTSVSLDAFVSTTDKKNDWVFPSSDKGSGDWTIADLWNAGLHIMGSNTFHDMASWWPGSTEEFAPVMNEIPKAVFSKDPHTTAREKWSDRAKIESDTGQKSSANSKNATPEKEQSWRDARVLTGDLAEEITKLKSEPGKDIYAHGGASFLQSLVKTGLVDEYHLLVHPIALGTGFGLFAKLPQRAVLRLISSQAFEKGAVAHIYVPAQA